MSCFLAMPTIPKNFTKAFKCAMSLFTEQFAVSHMMIDASVGNMEQGKKGENLHPFDDTINVKRKANAQT